MDIELKDWDAPEPRKMRGKAKPAEHRRFETPTTGPGIGETNVWLNPDLALRDETANLDSQVPSTLYYLGQVVDFPNVVQVYVEHRESGAVKHWAVIEERDYDLMEQIYEIEEDTLDKFPMSDLNFRVTIYTKGGPSISDHAKLIYNAK